MITFTFYIPHQEAETSFIMGALRSNKLRVTFSVGLRTETKHWDKKTQCVVKLSPDFAFISDRLADTKSAILKEIRIGELDNLSLQEIRDRILVSLGRAYASTKTTDDLISIYRTWATTSINQHNATRQHLQCFRVLEEYAQHCNKTTFAFDDVDYIFYTQFLKYLRENKSYKINTVATHIKNLKAVMNEIAKQKLHTNTEFKNFTKIQEEVGNVYLTYQELDLIHHLPLSGVKAKARDLFLIGCYTGMRFGDYSKLTIHDVAGEFIKYQQEKTGTFVTIPIHSRVKETITRYHGASKITQ